jgi:lipid A 3-O-deacylase
MRTTMPRPFVRALCLTTVVSLISSVFADGLLAQDTAPAATQEFKAPIVEFNAKKDPSAQLVIQVENDGTWANYFNAADRHYTSGQRATVALHPSFAYDWARALPLMDMSGKTEAAVGFFGGLDIYTPIDSLATAPIPNDWPYAGWLYGGVFFQRSNGKWLEDGRFTFGITGPSSMAQRAQDLLHEIFDVQKFQGWDNQLRDEPNFNFAYTRKLRAFAGQIDEDWALDIIPHAGFTLGSANREFVAGCTGRIGIHLDQSFGPGTLHHIVDMTHNSSHPSDPWSFYIFGRVEGRVVEHNMFLEGNNWSYSQGVDINHLVGEGTFGLALVLAPCVELMISNTYLTQEFKDQTTHDSYGTYQIKVNILF